MRSGRTSELAPGEPSRSRQAPTPTWLMDAYRSWRAIGSQTRRLASGRLGARGCRDGPGLLASSGEGSVNRPGLLRDLVRGSAQSFHEHQCDEHDAHGHCAHGCPAYNAGGNDAYGLATVLQGQRALSSLLRSRAIPLGIVHAPDEQAAEAAAIEPPAKPRAKRGLKMMAL